jgi:hypothetical protein
MMESQFPNLDAFLRYASHLLPKANVNLQNLGLVPTTFGCSHV